MSRRFSASALGGIRAPDLGLWVLDLRFGAENVSRLNLNPEILFVYSPSPKAVYLLQVNLI